MFATPDIAIFSFHPVKIITTGEGGAALTNDAKLAERMARLRSHGTTRDALSKDGRRRADGAWSYQMLELGWNYRITDIQAALGWSQIAAALDEQVRRRGPALAARYDRLLANSGLETALAQTRPRESSWHLYVVGWNEEATGLTLAAAFSTGCAAGIGVQCSLHPSPHPAVFPPARLPRRSVSERRLSLRAPSPCRSTPA